ncbi:MAG: Uma2 family endonuclease [Myxococcota bacterium]
MTAFSHQSHYTIDEYLRLEKFANVKHEYFAGQIFAMAGGTPEHGAMAMRIAISLGAQLAGRPCNVYPSDVRIRIVATGLDTYPDVSVVCGAEARDTEDNNALTNPIVIVEVLSPSTEAYDRGDKLEHYKQITSLRDVVLVSHEQRRVDVWRREEMGGWTTATARAGETLTLRSIDCTLDVDTIYTNPLGA